MKNLPQKTNFKNYTFIPHIEKLLYYFINEEKQFSLIESKCIITLFQQGYFPISEDVQKMTTVDPNIKISNPRIWLTLRLWLDLINFKNISEKTGAPLDYLFEQYLNIIGPRIDKTLLTFGSIANKYNVKDLNNNIWQEEIEKITNKKEQESFKYSYIADTLFSAEIRTLSWIYKELFNKEFNFNNTKKENIIIRFFKKILKFFQEN